MRDGNKSGEKYMHFVSSTFYDDGYYHCKPFDSIKERRRKLILEKTSNMVLVVVVVVGRKIPI